MPIARKPSAPSQAGADVEAFIQKGGSESNVSPESTPTDTVRPVSLRLPAELLSQVDAAVRSRRPSPTRHQWLLEAIYEKLERDG